MKHSNEYQYKVTQVYGGTGATLLVTDYSYFEAANIVVAAGFESSTSGSTSTIVDCHKEVSQVTFLGKCYIVERMA